MRKALVLGLVFAVGLGVVGFAQTLGVTWTTDVILDMTGGPWPTDVDILSELVVEYIVGDWTFGSETVLENGVWTDQDFRAAGVLGAFTISALVEFDPYGSGVWVQDWFEFETSLALAGVTFGSTFMMYSPGDWDLEITASGVAGDVTIDVELYLGWTIGCDFDFSWLTVDVGFPFCCADVAASIYFDCRGFEYVEFEAEGITIENLPWLTLGVYLVFDEGDKYFEFEPEIDLGLIGCDFDLYYRLNGGNLFGPAKDSGVLVVDAIAFDGISIACDIGGVEFTGVTYFGHGIWMEGYAGWGYYLPSALYGYEGMGFFEAYRIATTDDGCCGPFSFDVTFFFEDTDTLFDVSYVVANLEIQIATSFTFGMGIETDLDLGTVNDLTFTFTVEF